jgi:hypothetical protein
MGQKASAYLFQRHDDCRIDKISSSGGCDASYTVARRIAKVSVVGK